MPNVRIQLQEIYELIDDLRSATSAADKYAYAKQLKEKVDLLAVGLINEESEILSKNLKKYK